MSKRLGNKIRKTFKRLVATGSLNSNRVIMRWCEVTHVDGHDPDIESSVANIKVEREQEIGAMEHIGNYERTGYSRFESIAAGDIILDFPYDVDLIGKDDAEGVSRESVRFEWQGKIYTQKGAGDAIRPSADVVMGDIPICVTLLLELGE